MNKKEYLDKLTYEIGNLSAEQKDEIISIFSEHFEQGLLDGKSEEEICRGLGSPAYVAVQFIENNREALQNAREKPAPEAPRPVPASQQRPQQTPEHANAGGQTYTGEIDIDKSFDPAGVHKIYVNILAGDIKVFTDATQGENLRVVINGLSKNTRFDINVADGVLNVIENRKFVLINLFNFMRAVRVEIYVPQSFEGTLYLKDSAGNVDFNGLKLRSSEIRTTAGDVKITGHTGELELHSTAGNAYLSNTCGKMYLHSTAGDVKVEDCDGDIEARTTAGNIKIANNNGRISASTSAGNINVKAHEIFGLSASSSAGNVKIDADRISGDTELSSSAGNVSLETREVAGSISVKSSLGNATVILPRDASMRISSRTGGGKIKSDFTDNPNSPYFLDVSTSLGTVSVKSRG